MSAETSYPLLDETAIRCMSAEALDRIISTSTPKLLFWDIASNRLRAVSATAGRAKIVIAQPTCLGVYDFDTKLEDIIADFQTVCQA